MVIDEELCLLDFFVIRLQSVKFDNLKVTLDHLIILFYLVPILNIVENVLALIFLLLYLPYMPWVLVYLPDKKYKVRLVKSLLRDTYKMELSLF